VLASARRRGLQEGDRSATKAELAGLELIGGDCGKWYAEVKERGRDLLIRERGGDMGGFMRVLLEQGLCAVGDANFPSCELHTEQGLCSLSTLFRCFPKLSNPRSDRPDSRQRKNQRSPRHLLSTAHSSSSSQAASISAQP